MKPGVCLTWICARGRNALRQAAARLGGRTEDGSLPCMQAGRLGILVQLHQRQPYCSWVWLLLLLLLLPVLLHFGDGGRARVQACWWVSMAEPPCLASYALRRCCGTLNTLSRSHARDLDRCWLAGAARLSLSAGLRGRPAPDWLRRNYNEVIIIAGHRH